MRLLEAFEVLCETKGPLGEMAKQIGKGILEFGHSLADALDDFAEELRGLEEGLADGEGEGSRCGSNRLYPGLESNPGLKAAKGAIDSIVNFCDKAELAISDATGKMEVMTERVTNS
jgi:hypothetical protein